MLPYGRNLRDRSRELRNNMTAAERIVWNKLRLHQLKGHGFSRQKPLGGYIVDFYSKSAGVVVEIDGAHHFSEEGKEYDREKDAYLTGMGLNVLRFSNSEVTGGIEGVIKRITAVLPE